MPRLSDRQVVATTAQEPWPEQGELSREPWLKWPQEKPYEYYAFCAFRDSPPFKRTVGSAYRFFRGKEDPPGPRQRPAPRAWHHLAKRFWWERRTEAYDRQNERAHLAAMDEAVLHAYQEMGERHAREAMALQAKALERLRMINPAELSADTVLRFIVQAATLERLARGASLRDLAQAQREREQSGATITYVDDWRGDQQRLERLRQEGSHYGNGQGVLPVDIEEKRPDVAVVRPGGLGGNPRKPSAEERSWWDDRLTKPLGDDPWRSADGRSAQVPVSEPPQGPDHGPGEPA